MTREEKANSLGQEYFPDEANIWARPNFEAQYVSEACISMAEWEHKRLVDKACQWLKKYLFIHNEEVEDKDFDWVSCDFSSVEEFIDNFVKAMKE